MKKYILLFALFCVTMPLLALDPMLAYRVRPPEGCVDKNIAEQELNLDDLIQISICTNPSLAAQYMGVKAQEATLGSARSEYLPSVKLTATGNIAGQRTEGQSFTQNEPYTAKAEASWLLFDWGGREARISSTRAYVNAAISQYDAALQELVLSVQRAYLNLLAAQESLISAKASLDTYKQSYDEAQKRYKLGMVSLSDKLQARTRYEQALLAVVQDENLVQQYRGTLAILLNLSPDANLKLHMPIFDESVVKIENDNIQDLMNLARQNRPEMHAQESSEKAAKANLRTARTRMMPSLSATASASYNDNWKRSYPYGTDNAAGLLLSWPLFSGFSNMYAAQQASYAYKQAQVQTQNVTRQIENEVWSSYQNYKTALSSYEISQTVLESAEENHRVAFRYYEVGKTDIISLLTAVAQLADARQNKITAFYSLLLSKANLARSIGKY